MTLEAENVPQKKRGRKKLLYQSILKQMEFYFSPANLAKDRWLSNKLQEDECIHLTEFLKFNKIKQLTDNMNDLERALRKSELLRVTDDMKVALVKPVQLKENEEDYVIYVEQVPPDADHDWIRDYFSVYGKIDYISVPKFKNSKKCKGFAFIEFAEIESAQKAIQDFQEKGLYLSTDIAPEELLSIANYEGNNLKNEERNSDNKEVQSENEIDQAPSDSNDSDKNSRKRKTSENLESDQEQKKLKTESADENISANLELSEENEQSEKEDVNTDETKKKKNRKKKKKKKKSKENVENSGLQILSKKDWRRLRNKYLNMQKEKMKQLKKHLYTAQKKSDSSKQNGAQWKKIEIENKKTQLMEEKKSEYHIPFSPGLIVKLKFDEPVVDVKGLKNDLKKNTSIKFVDVKEGVQEVYLRFETVESALDFSENSSWENTEVLEGQKESDYWDKLQKQREEKLSKKTRKKERGKDKLMKKAENILGKHITFDET